MVEVIELNPASDLSECAINSAIDALSIAAMARVYEANTVLKVSIWATKEAIKLAAWFGCEVRIVKEYREDEWSLLDSLHEREVHTDGA